MALLSLYARKKKIEHFLKRIPKHSRILEIGCGTGWLGQYLKDNGWNNYTGIDINPPANIVGDIRDWRKLGLKECSFDVIIAFEVVEHVDCFKECFELLTEKGMLMLTSPVPHMDWMLKILEIVGLNQRRTSVHDHLVYLKDVPYFEDKEIKTIGFLSQWAILTK
ncbi:MAG: class I SAM-dependent methyltransferase [Planctomycetota bacterium]|jgi:2-polyprenyl-3-methyl-5-hydroxy-6-metoxy-1,4-benzoquinol methylase